MKIIIMDEADGVGFLVKDEQGDKYFRLDQEDDATIFVDLFNYLNIDSEYEEVY